MSASGHATESQIRSTKAYQLNVTASCTRAVLPCTVPLDKTTPTVFTHWPTAAHLPGGDWSLARGPNSARLTTSAADTLAADYQTQLRTDFTEDVLGRRKRQSC